MQAAATDAGARTLRYVHGGADGVSCERALAGGTKLRISRATTIAVVNRLYMQSTGLKNDDSGGFDGMGWGILSAHAL